MQHPALIAAATAAVLCCAPVQAADVTPDQAHALEGQVTTWLSDMLGPDVKLRPRPVQITPDGERFRIAVPIAVTRDDKPDTITLTGVARQDGNRWTIDALRAPFPVRFTAAVPQAPREGRKDPLPPVAVSYTVNAASQDSQVIWDPSFTTPSTWNASFTDLQVDASGAGVRQSTRVARSASSTILRPSGTDRVDVVLDSTTEGYSSTSKPQDSEELKLAGGRVRVTGELTAVSRERAGQVLRSFIRIGSVAMANAPKAGTKTPSAAPALDMRSLRPLLQAMADFASEFTLDETVDNLAVSYGSYGGTAAQFSFGMGAKSNDGMLQGHMDIGVDGLALPDLPLGAMADLLPKRIALRPVVSGVATEDLLALANAAAEARDGNPPPGAWAGLFSRGGVNAGLESFLLDVGGATFTGMGTMTIPSPNQVAGTAQVTATRFDALVAKANAIPEMAGVMPLFTFAKGLGRTVDTRLVWDVTYKGGKVLVNGTDLSAMMGGRPK